MTFKEIMVNEDFFKHHKKKKKEEYISCLLIWIMMNLSSIRKKIPKEMLNYLSKHSDYDEMKLKHHKKKEKEKPDLFAKAHTDSNEYEPKQHKKEAEFLRISDCSEINHHHRKKKKGKQDLFTEAHIDFNKDEPTQHKNKKSELFMATSDYDETKSKHHKKKKEKPDLLAETHIDDSNDYEPKQHKKEAKFLGISDYSEISYHHHKKKKKGKQDLFTEAHIDFKKDEPTQDKNKKAELFMATSDYDETKSKHHKKKKKEKPELLAKVCTDFNIDEFTQHKEKDELLIRTADYNKTKLKHHKKKKKKEKPDLHAETYSYFHKDKQHCQKQKTDLLIETCADYDETKHKHHKRKKQKDLLIETCVDFNEKELQQHKKKQQKKSELPAETNVDFKKNVFQQQKKKRKKKEKPDLIADTSSSGFNKNEAKQHKKRENKIALPDEFQSGENIDLNLLCSDIYTESQINFDRIHKHKKRHKENNVNKQKIFVSIEEGELPSPTEKKDEIPACVSEANISNEDQISTYNKKRKKFKRYKDKSYVSESLERPDFMSGKQKAEKCQMTATEGKSGYYEFKIDYSNHHKKRKSCLNVAKESSITDDHEIFSKKLKKIEKCSGNTELSTVYQHLNCSKTDIGDTLLGKEISHSSIFNNDIPECSYVNNDLGTTTFHSLSNDANNDSPSNIFNQHLNCTEIDVSDTLLGKKNSHLHILNNDKRKCNIVNDDLSTTFHSLSNNAHNHSLKKRKHLENSTSIVNKYNDENPDHEINKEDKDVGIIDYTKEHLSNFTNTKDLQNPVGIRNSSNVEAIEHTYFSSDVDSTEDPVDFEIPPLHKFETVCRLTESQKNDLLASGVFIKTGKFTTADDKIVQRNFEHFVKNYGVSDPFSLFGIGRYQKDPELLKFLKAKHFYVRLAKDLNDRSLHSIYKRARLILHPYKNSEKLTEKEIEHIKRLRKNLSNRWNQIGDTLGITAEKCAETYRWHETTIAKGHFTKEEEDKLIEALKKVSNNSDISCKNIKNISWQTVASYVPSRNDTQCRMYWANNLAWAPGSARKKWNKDCYRKLVHILKEMNVENSSMIDWYKVYESFEDFAPSDLYVLKRWLYIRSQVPDYKNKSHKEIVNILWNKYSL